MYGEKLGKNADMGDYIKDFQKSDAPQFKGKSKEKRKDMAIAAYLSRNEEMEKLDEKIAGLVKKSKQTGIPYGILKKSYDRGMAYVENRTQKEHYSTTMGICESELYGYRW